MQEDTHAPQDFVVEFQGKYSLVKGVHSFFIDDKILIFRNHKNEPCTAIRRWEVVCPYYGKEEDGQENAESDG